MPVTPKDTRLSKPSPLRKASAYSIEGFKPGPPTIKG
jgi:hypothetical protein